MDINIIKKALSNYDQAQVEVYTSYLTALANARDKKKQLKNPWLKYKTDAELVTFFKKVALDGLTFDGIHITLQSTGVGFDYIALKNLLYIKYPGCIIDMNLVYKDDEFKFEKRSGEIFYTHAINNPFGQTEKDIIGAYCIIKCSRGNFITLLNKAEIEKRRKKAKTDMVWAQWPAEMSLKSVIKRAVKVHFADISQNIESLDNESTDLELPLDINVEVKAAIEKINTLEELTKYYIDNKGKQAGVLEGFVKLLAKRKAEIEEAEKKKAEAEKKEPVDDSIREPGSDDN